MNSERNNHIAEIAMFIFSIFAFVFVLSIETGQMTNFDKMEKGAWFFAGITILGTIIAISVLIGRKIKGTIMKKIVVTTLIMTGFIITCLAVFYGTLCFWL